MNSSFPRVLLENAKPFNFGKPSQCEWKVEHCMAPGIDTYICVSWRLKNTENWHVVATKTLMDSHAAKDTMDILEQALEDMSDIACGAEEANQTLYKEIQELKRSNQVLYRSLLLAAGEKYDEIKNDPCGPFSIEDIVNGWVNEAEKEDV